MKNAIKEKMIEAGRYEEIISIVNDFINDKQSTYPVYPFIYNGTTIWRVDGSNVNKEAICYLDLITKDEITNVPSFEDFRSFYHLALTRLDDMLHNYANSISHRVDPTNNMETIRCLHIIVSSINCLFDFNDWIIPDGWKEM